MEAYTSGNICQLQFSVFGIVYYNTAATSHWEVETGHLNSVLYTKSIINKAFPAADEREGKGGKGSGRRCTLQLARFCFLTVKDVQQ